MEQPYKKHIPLSVLGRSDNLQKQIKDAQKATLPVLQFEVAESGCFGSKLPLLNRFCQTYWKPNFGGEGMPEEDVTIAAMVGYCVPEDAADTVEEKRDDNEEVQLTGDVEKLSVNQKRVLLRLKETQQHTHFKLKQISLSFSGAAVFFFSPSRKDGTPMPSSVLKFDIAANVKEEIGLTQKYGKLFGLTTPKVKDSHFLADVDENDPSAVMQIDLCGGIFGLPEFASAPPVHTFASVIQDELKTNQRQVDVVPIINEALERRMYAFTMSSRSVRKVNLAGMYKLARFVGHGVLNRAKEGAKRAQKNPALAAGFINPPDIDNLDPDGSFLRELSGTRKTVKDFFKAFVSHEQKFDGKFEREVVCGLAHNDLHGGNLLLDSQGLVWLIDFATVKNNVHVLMDLAKFMASCLFLYLEDNVSEMHVHMFAKLLCTTPDATTALPLVGGDDLKNDLTATFVLVLLTRLRHCMCIYEIGDDVPNNDGVPFSLALFSWSARMLSYSEPNLHQKSRALYFALVGAHRVMWDAGIEIGSTALEWVEEFRLVWEGQKGRRLSTSATQVQVVSFEFQVEFPRYLAQIGTSEAWSTDFLTREKVHVTDHCISVDVKFTGRIFPRYLELSPETKSMMKKMQRVYEVFIPEVMNLERYQGRLFIIGDSGTGKTLLTKQLFSEVSQEQLLDIRGEVGDIRGMAGQGLNGTSLIPVRVPLIDLGRQLEADPDLPLTADPVTDLLTQWIQRKYGQDSVPHKLIYDVRNMCLGSAQRTSERRASTNSGDMLPDPSLASQEQGMRGSGSEAADIYATSEIAGLFLLFDGLDEASSFKLPVVRFVKSLLQCEPMHLSVLTSRPGNLGREEFEILQELGFNSFRMSALTLPQATAVAENTLKRLRDPPETVAAIVKSMCDPGYSVLRENPLILTLLVHVLRKFRQQNVQTGDDAANTEERTRADVMKKTEVYQRAVKLILHQSDSAKFQLREGRSDQAMVRRLEMLKSVRARKLFQTVSFHSHGQRGRAISWTGMKDASTDIEMQDVLKDAFQQGRMPIFEQVETCDEEPKVQLTHLSFQELMTGEYSSAIVRHAHATQKTRAYVNCLLSCDSKSLDRERLSEQWWVQVWFHIFEMLEASAFEEWSALLAEDERSILKVGSTVLAPPWGMWSTLFVTERAERRPWEGGGVAHVVMYIDWDEFEAVVKMALDECVQRAVLRWWLPIEKVPMPGGEMPWRLDGVGVLFRHACLAPNLEVIDKLTHFGVHPNLVGDEGTSPLINATMAKKWGVLKVLSEYKIDYSWFTNLEDNLKYTNSGGHDDPLFVRTWRLNDGMDEFRVWKPYGILEQAQNGTLVLDPEIDLNFSDPQNGMTPLMLAATAGQVELVKTLIARRANVNAETFEGCTALSLAGDCDNGRAGVECMKQLIAARSDVHVKVGRTLRRFIFQFEGRHNSLLHGPSVLGDTEKIGLLLRARVDATACSDLGNTPLHKCSGQGHVEICKLLHAAGADINADMAGWCSPGTGFSGRSADFHVCYFLSGVTPFFSASLWGGQSLPMLEWFFDVNFDANAEIRLDHVDLYKISHYTWMTGLDFATFVGEDLSKQKLFFEKGYDPNMARGRLCLNGMHDVSFMFANPVVFNFMLNNGKADLNKKAWMYGNFEDMLKYQHGTKPVLDVLEDFKKMKAGKADDQ